MADEKVNIVVKVITKTKQLDALLAKLKAVEAMEDRLSSGRNVQKYAQGAGAALTRATSKWKKHFDYVDSGIKMFGKALTGFLKFAIKGVLIEMGLLAVAMVGWHALVKGGQYIVKAYHGVMQLLAGGAAAATIAIATVSAAIREQQAAMYAYRGKGARQFGSGMNQTAMAMRNLQMNAELASLGVEALNGAYASMSKTMKVTQINASGASIKALMDFGAAGQDPKKAAAQVGTIVAALNDEKKSLSNVISEAKKLGPEMEKALKGTKIKTKQQFKELLMSGELAKKGGVLGQFDAVNETLISQLTKYFTLLRGKFADFGEQFLGPVKVAFEKIFNVISRDLSRLMASIMFNPGGETFIDGLANGVEKFSGWLVKTIRDYLPKIQGMFDRMGNWWSNFKRGWNLVLERLRPLIDGARVIEKAFGEVWKAIKEGAENMGHMRELLLANESTVIETGTRIGDLIRDVSDLLFRMKTVFFEILPFLNDVLSGIGMLIRGMTKLLTGLGGGGGSFLKALAPLLAFQIFGKRMQGAAGRLMPQGTDYMKTVPTMNVTATNVNVNGSPAGGAAMPSGARMSSGAGGPGSGPIAAGYAYQPYGPAMGAMATTRLPLGAMPRLHGVDHRSILLDNQYKQETMGMRGVPAGGLTPMYGGGMIVAQARYGATGPTAFENAGPQMIPSREFMKTDRTIYDAAYANAMPRNIGEKNLPHGRGRLGYQDVYQDVRAYSGVYRNERGIDMSYAQASQSPFGAISFDPRLRLGEAMRLGGQLKSGFEVGDKYRAGMDQRAYERAQMFQTGPGTPTPTMTNRAGNPDVDYTRMGNRRLNRLARSRGVGGGTLDQTVDALRRQDRDRAYAHQAVAAGDNAALRAAAEAKMSAGFLGGEYNRWIQNVKNDKGEITGTKVVDPGLTAREALTRSGMSATSRLKDVGAVVGNKARKAAGIAQGFMGYGNQGRYDASLNDGKGGFVNTQEMRQEAYKKMMFQRGQTVEFDKETQTWKNKGEPTGMNRGKGITKLNYLRERARIARSETKFGAASKRFAQSGTGRMGTSMGLGLMSQYAPEEMQGAMALGGMVSTIDPRLGLAVAGIGGALKAKSVGAGAMAGMAGGAAIGQMFGPYGALIGAGIGALGGAIMGAINKNKALMNEARQAAQNSINSVFTGIAAAASKQFDRNREDQEAGIDISNRKRAFGGMSEKFSAKRQKGVFQAIESVFADYPEFVEGYKEEVLTGKKLGPRDATTEGYGTVTQTGSKFGHSMNFGDNELGNKHAREFIQYFYDNQKNLGMNISADDFAKMTKSDSAARAGATRLSSLGGTQEKVLKNMEQVNDKRIEALSRATGKSGAELEVLAQELGVNLYDATVKYSDLVKQMGGAMIKTADQLNNALIDLFMNTGNKYKTNIKAREAQHTIDRASQGYRDKMLAKDATEEEKQIATDEYFADYASNVLALNKGDAFAAYTDTRDLFKRGDAFKEGNVFAGMEGTQAQSEGLVLVDQMRKDMETGIIGQMTGMAANAGQEFDAKKMQEYISGLSDAEFETLAAATYSKNKATGKTRLENLYGDGGDAGMQNIMKILKMDPTKLGYKTVEAGEAGERGALDEFTGDLKELAKKQGLDYKIMSDAVTMYKTTTEAFFKGAAGGPDWWQKGLAWDDVNKRLVPGGDTSSPRGDAIGDTTTSKLSQTMARHQAMDGQLTGKRSVTSSWRNFNLGSSNSDHVTGRAYDLVGQNLGKYATMVHANGGFAEFHGNMAERHLHVVPGPVPGVGDTPVPANNTAVASMANSPAAGPGKYTININGANASPEAIANMVMARLDDRERKYRER